MATEYKWAPGARIKVTAQDAGAALSDLQEENGGKLTARIVVDSARDIGSALHEAFEWDDVRAGELYRENQARHLMACIRVVRPAQGTDTTQTLERVYVNVTEQNGDDEDRFYVPTQLLKDSPELFEQVRSALLADLKRARAKVSEFEALVAVVDEVIEKTEATLPIQPTA